MEIGNEISQKIKTAIKSKLVEFGSYVDDELPDYIMVMVANKRSQSQMIDDLQLFLGDNSNMFCDWLHDLLYKLQEVTEGAFELKVPITINPDDVKNEIKTNDTLGTDPLKISKICKNPSPIRMPNTSNMNHGESFENQNEDLRDKNECHSSKSSDSIKMSTEKNEETSDKGELVENTGMLQSVVTIQKRPILPPSKQANPMLLKKAMKAATQMSDVHHGEYNPELPASINVQNILNKNPESKRRQRELLLEEHKKLQRMKSQQEEEDEESREPMIELLVEQDDDLFATEENLVKDKRIVVDKNAELETSAELEVTKKDKSKSQGKKEKKHEKRKLDEDASNDACDESNQSGSNSEEDGKPNKKQRSVRTKEKKRKPKFIVTLEGVGHEFEEKYEKEQSRKKKRRKSIHKEEERLPILNENVPVIPIYPPLIHGVHQVPGVQPNPIQPLIQVIPRTTIAQLPVNTAMHAVTEDLENEDEEMPLLSNEKCCFWPQCKNGEDCPYYHPDVNCKHFPNCRYGNDCGYLHPPCKFGSMCTSSSCSYSHLPTPSPDVSTEISTLCRYHPFCTKENCPFLHRTEKPCRYGTKCTRAGCVFSHSTPPPREQLKWVAAKAHVSDRQFAVTEASTTPLSVQ